MKTSVQGIANVYKGLLFQESYSDKVHNFNRAIYRENYLKKIKEKLKLIEDKVYNIVEIDRMMEEHCENNRAILYKPKSPQTGKEIIEALVLREMIICDQIDESYGFYHLNHSEGK